ncbi:ATP-binding protein [Ammonicoccus fulvus]|uniref:ATP-binding protein n=1 Tax=Ammonicoccus fulvus TaxID=3138240 RepID=A0ABZ3FWY2_9ACTN
MNADGLAPSQHRAIGLTLGALYGFHALRGLLTHGGTDDTFEWAMQALSSLAWVPGVLALIAFIAHRIDMGRILLAIGACTYPIAVAFWPLVANAGSADARLDFWIHQIPGLAAVAAIFTLPLWTAIVSLFLNCLLVEIVMWRILVVTTWDVSIVRFVFSIAYSGFFFVLMLFLIAKINSTNRVLARTAREQAEAGMLESRDAEIDRLDRLTHDFVLSLLSSAAEGVPTDKLRVQAEAARRQLTPVQTEVENSSLFLEVIDRITRRCGREGVPVTLSQRGIPEDSVMPRLTAIELEAAVAEAVRNTVRHATEPGRVEIVLDGPRLKVVISDDGPGFDPTRIRTRLGVTQSILHRMNSLEGGSATVDSAPGRGTVVTIAWEPT